ncbi:MAG TPA: DUF169 domain-containing protein [Methanotrichaceae archaeon]|nr:DUF169 domain-containing protein [Methanotrichaceae archaeon]
MESKIAKAIGLESEPVAIIWSDRMPEGALHFKSCGAGCIMGLFAQATRGKVSAFGRENFGCMGGGTGLGFGNTYENFPLGGAEAFKYFLSTGVEGVREDLAEKARAIGREGFSENMLKGEGMKKTPQLVEQFLKELPVMDIPAKYVVFKPLSQVEDERPKVVVFIVNPDQLSALVTLANFGRPGVDNVIIPMGAGCHQIGIYPFREAQSERQRAVVGLTDPAARKNVRNILGNDVLTFAVPFELFREMEENVGASFLSRSLWKSLMEKSKD